MASGTIKSYTLPSNHYSGGGGAHWSFEWTSTKKAAGVSTVSWNLYTRGRYSSPTWLETGCWMSVSKNGTTTQLYSGSNFSGSENSFKDKWRASGTFDVTHNANGYASFTINFEVFIYEYAHKTNSGMGVLDSLPTQATLTSAPNFNDENNPTINYSNPAGTAATSLQACIANSTGGTIYVPYRDISKTDTSYQFTLTDAERNTLRNATKNSNSLAVRFYVKTVIDGSTYYSSLEKTLSIVNANPIVNASAVDTNSTTIALTGDNTKYVKYYSNVQASMTATGQKGATITSTSGAGTHNNVETNSFTFSATDSRGNSTRKTVTGTLIPYVRLTCNMGNDIPDTSGNMNVKCSGNYFNGSFGAVSNTLTVQYRYKVHGGSYGSWTNMTVTKSGNTYNASASLTGLDYQTTYVFQTRATDKLSTVSTGENAVKSLPLFHWGENDFVFECPVTFNREVHGVDIGGGGGSIGNNVDGDLNVTGNLRLKGSGNYGNTLHFGDGSYCYISEPTDDDMTIKASDLNLNASNLYFNQRSIVYGEWTPTLSSSSAVSSYSVQKGWYQKLGSVVTIGFTIKATCKSGYNTTGISISGVPFTPSTDASGGGICSGTYVSAGFNFECWVVNTSGNITGRVQSCNNTVPIRLTQAYLYRITADFAGEHSSPLRNTI